jgi:hypothetical protein
LLDGARLRVGVLTTWGCMTLVMHPFWLWCEVLVEPGTDE